MREAVSLVFPKESMRELFSHELRWAIGLRIGCPLAYARMIFTHGLPWAVLAAILATAAGWTGVAVAYLTAYFVLRLCVAWIAGVWGLRDPVLRANFYFRCEMSLPLRRGGRMAVGQNYVERLRISR